MIVLSIFAHELRWIAKVDLALGGLWSVVITPSIKLFVRLAFCVFLCPFAIDVATNTANLLWYWNHIDEQNVRFTFNMQLGLKSSEKTLVLSSPCLFHLESQPQVCMLIDLWKTPVEMCGTSWNTPLRQWHRQLQLPVSQQTFQGEVGMTTWKNGTLYHYQSISIHTIPSCQFTSVHVEYLSRSTLCCTAMPVHLSTSHSTAIMSKLFSKWDLFVTYGISMHFLAPKASCLSAATPQLKYSRRIKRLPLFLCFIAGWEVWK